LVPAEVNSGSLSSYEISEILPMIHPSHSRSYWIWSKRTHCLWTMWTFHFEPIVNPY